MKVLVSDNYLQDIANAIRNRSGISDTFKPGEMAEGIANIPTPTTEDYMRISDLLEYPKTPDEEWYVESEVTKVEDLITHFENLEPGPEPNPNEGTGTLGYEEIENGE